ncbi:hypothetical protein KC19_VG017300 [Ceratodon purpureus]|uniref:Uncharacterized protein n=1 Tax=Ceratodon purpureus TaxID=3225 RepID=A0A8T0HL27_CERPU|nr:hypothetical protein KC19_VG017300 [Ceratodon purpureus]
MRDSDEVMETVLSHNFIGPKTSLNVVLLTRAFLVRAGHEEPPRIPQAAYTALETPNHRYHAIGKYQPRTQKVIVDWSSWRYPWFVNRPRRTA